MTSTLNSNCSLSTTKGTLHYFNKSTSYKSELQTQCIY